MPKVDRICMNMHQIKMYSNFMKAIMIEVMATVTDCPMLNQVIPFYCHLPAIESAIAKPIQSQYPAMKLPT